MGIITVQVMMGIHPDGDIYLLDKDGKFYYAGFLTNESDYDSRKYKSIEKRNTKIFKQNIVNNMKKDNNKKSSVQDFADTIKDNPEKIIAWAKREIAEYEKLIKILEKRKKMGNIL